MKKRNVIFAALIAFSGLVNAQTTEFQDKTGNVDKIGSYLDFPTEGRNTKNGSGYSTNVDLLDPKPKKVALVSYYLYDPGAGKTGGSIAMATASASVWRTSDKVAQEHVDGFYNNSIDALKETFKQYGMDLLIPEQYLDNAEKEDFYYNFNQESAKKEKTTATVFKSGGAAGMATATVSTIKISPTGKGYRDFFVANEETTNSLSTHFLNTGVFGANRTLTSSLGYELCKGLGVDAVVICYIVTHKVKANKENYAVNAVNLYMFGPNPKSEGPEDKNRGQFYCGVRFYKDGSLEFQNEKEKIQSFDGMDNMMKALGGRLCNYVINKVKK